MSRKLLKELTLSITDGEHGTVSHDVDGVHLLLSAKNLVNGKVVVFSEERKISYTDFWKIRSRTKLEKDDVLLSTTGTIGNIAIATECEHFDFNRDVAMIKCDKRKILPEYLYYYLLMPSTQKRLMFRTKGGTQKHLYLADIEGFEIDLPDMVEQQKIVRFLRKIDDKIITNCRINDNLAAMAYDTYIHSFYGEQPNGKLNDILIENEKSKVQVGDAKNSDGDYPFFTSGEAILRWDDNFVEGRNCFLNTGGNADVKFYVGKAAYSTDTWCISANQELADYMYLLLLSIKPELDKKFFQGTGLKHLQKPLLKDRPIYIPTSKEILVFNSHVQAWFDNIAENTRENQHLIKLRDWLLPMLMNGQATIDD